MNELIALDFPTQESLERAFGLIYEEGYPFEILPGRIIGLPEEIAQKLETASFGSKRIPIISLDALPAEEAKAIRRRHWFR